MKTLLKLLIAAAMLNATARAAMAAWEYYQFKDAAQQSIVFGGRATTGQLHDQILRRGQELELPIQPEQIAVTRDGARTLAEVSYTQAVELFPRYHYPFNFSFKVDAVAVDSATTTDVLKP